MRLSIRYQLLLPLALLLIGLFAMCAWTANASAERARRQIAQQIDGIATTLRDGQYPLNLHVLEQMKGLSGADFLLIHSNSERVATLDASMIHEKELDQSAGHPLTRIVRVGTDGFLLKQVALRYTHPNSDSRLYVLYPESRLDSAVWHAVRPILLLGLAGGIASVVLTLGVAHRFVQRVRALEQRTRVIAAGDFSPMKLPARDDELRDLAKSVNEMAAKLNLLQETVSRTERMRLLGQVAGGLAHQLRNGVTGAQLALQLHAQTCSGGDPEALDVALRQLTRVTADLQRFFDLGSDGKAREPCSMTEIIDETIGLLLPQCRHARIDLQWQPTDHPINVLGDAGRLGHLVFNVIGNAVEAAGPGGSVQVQLRVSTDNRIHLEVTDSGPGPPERIAARLFEPFVTGKPEGIGLGLAVAHEVAVQHGGRIAWNRVDGRTCFAIELPALRPVQPEDENASEAAVAHR